MLTKRTFLLIKNTAGTIVDDGGDKYSLLCTRGITEYPDLDGEIDAVDCTTLSDEQMMYEAGLPDSGGPLAFPTFFSKADLDNIATLDESKTYEVAIWFGATVDATTNAVTPTGTEYKRKFNAQIRYRITGGAVGDVRPAEIDLFFTNDTPETLAAFPVAGSEG